MNEDLGKKYMQDLLASIPYKDWAKDHTIDAAKIQSEMKGIRKPLPASLYARSIVNLIRLFVPQNFLGYRGNFNKKGALWRLSDSEDIQRAKNAGLGWALLQKGADDWSLIKSRCNLHNIPVGYWFHCRNESDVLELLSYSKLMNSPIVGINIEKELEDVLNPVRVRQLINLSGYTGEISIIAYGWIQNSVRVTDTDLGRYAWILEMFPSDAPDLMPPSEKWPQCVQHAKELGIRYPFQLMQCYHGAVPTWYDRTTPSSIYTADDIHDNFELWL